MLKFHGNHGIKQRN